MSLVDNTVRVRRGGSFLTIPRDSINQYLAKGYDVVDSKGNVLQESVPNDPSALRMAYEKHIAEIKTLKERIAELESQLAKKAEAPKKEPEPVVETKTSTTRKKKS